MKRPRAILACIFIILIAMASLGCNTTPQTQIPSEAAIPVSPVVYDNWLADIMPVPDRVMSTSSTIELIIPVAAVADVDLDIIYPPYVYIYHDPEVYSGFAETALQVMPIIAGGIIYANEYIIVSANPNAPQSDIDEAVQVGIIMAIYNRCILISAQFVVEWPDQTLFIDAMLMKLHPGGVSAMEQASM